MTAICRAKTYKGKNLPDLKWPVLSRPTSLGHWEASLNGKQVGNNSLPRVSTPHSPPLAIIVIKRKIEVLTPETVMH